MIGSLMFLSLVTRPDLAYIVNFLSRYVCNFDKSHWIALQRVLEYLKNTTKMGVTYKADNNNEMCVKCFSDADFAGKGDKR